MPRVLKFWMKRVASAGLILWVWTGPAAGRADCPEGPWVTVGRFGYGSIAQLAYSPDGVRVAVGGSGGVTIWNTEKATVEQVLEGHTSYVTSVAWWPYGCYLASGSYDGVVRWWGRAPE